MSDFDFGQDFNRKGEKNSQYGPDYTFPNVEEFKGKVSQGEALVKFLQNKFGNIDKKKRYDWRDEMLELNSFEFMNVEYLGSALILIDTYYNNQNESYQNVFKMVFRSDTIMEPFYDLLIEKSKKKTDVDYETRKLSCKQFLYSYIFKVLFFRAYRNPDFITSQYKTVPEESTIPVPNI